MTIVNPLMWFKAGVAVIALGGLFTYWQLTKPPQVLRFDRDQLTKIWVQQMSKHLELNDAALKQRTDLFVKTANDVVVSFTKKNHAILLKPKDAPSDTRDVTPDILKEVSIKMRQLMRASS